jgi:hypothetical protein
MRKDGRRLDNLAAFYRLTPFMMKTRGDASNFYRDTVNIETAEIFARKLRSEGLKQFGMLHVFVAAYHHTVMQFPALNRFISGQRIYARNQLEIVMTVKKKLSTESGETSYKIVLEPGDTIREVYGKMSEAIAKIKADSGDNATENTAEVLMKFPRILLKFIIWMLGFLDYFSILPQSIIDASPFHGSLVITDLGSIGIGPIYHHLYNFGNVPVFLAFGRKSRRTETDLNGNTVERRYIDYAVVCDERICDGYYYAQAFRHINHYLHNPELLEKAPPEVNSDIL